MELDSVFDERVQVVSRVRRTSKCRLGTKLYVCEIEIELSLEKRERVVFGLHWPWRICFFFIELVMVVKIAGSMQLL